MANPKIEKLRNRLTMLIDDFYEDGNEHTLAIMKNMSEELLICIIFRLIIIPTRSGNTIYNTCEFY